MNYLRLIVGQQLRRMASKIVSFLGSMTSLTNYTLLFWHALSLTIILTLQRSIEIYGGPIPSTPWQYIS